MNGPIQFLLESVFGFFLTMLLLRFWMQARRAPFQNPIGDFAIRLTNWLVRPLRRIVPPIGIYDTASIGAVLLGCVLLQMLEWGIFIRILPAFSGWIIGMGLLGLLYAAKLALYLLLGSTIFLAIMSWISPHHLLIGMLNLLVQPFLRPIQRLIPPLSGIDLSPMILILALQMTLYYVIPPAASKIYFWLQTGGLL